MKNNFLIKLDELFDKQFEEEKVNRNIVLERKTYVAYFFYEPEISTRIKFLIRKSDTKAKLFLCLNSQRVYLSDADILKIISVLEPSEQIVIFNALLDLYQSDKDNIIFKIEGEEYSGWGINLELFNKDIVIHTDSKINLRDLVALLNFIFSKDRFWADISANKDFRYQTIGKYILLMDYYIFKTGRANRYLKELGYPLSASSYNNFHKKYFKELKKLDISVFL